MTSQVQEAIDRFAHSRAYVRKAIHAITTQRRIGNLQYYADPNEKKRNRYVGPTYAEIRLWISRELKVTVADVGRRCRDLFDLGEMCKETEPNGRVHVYPMEK